MVYFLASPLLRSPLREVKPPPPPTQSTQKQKQKQTQKQNQKQKTTTDKRPRRPIFAFTFVRGLRKADKEGGDGEPTSPTISCIGRVREKPEKESRQIVNNNNNNNNNNDNDKNKNNNIIIETSGLHRGDMIMHLDPLHDNSSPRILISDEVVEETWIWRDVHQDGASLSTIVPKR